MEGGEQKTWPQLKQRVQELHQKLTCLYTMHPTHVNFRQLPDGRTRIFFLSNGPASAENALLCADVQLNELSRQVSPLESDNLTFCNDCIIFMLWCKDP